MTKLSWADDVDEYDSDSASQEKWIFCADSDVENDGGNYDAVCDCGDCVWFTVRVYAVPVSNRFAVLAELDDTVI